MEHAVILHTIQDADHCIQQGFHQKYMLFSTDVHVSYYLRHHYELECRDLCSYLDAQTIRQVQDKTLKISHALLEELDRHLAPAINEQLNLSIRYFIPLYSLTAARQLSLYALLKICIERIFAEYTFDSILIYDTKLGPLNGNIKDFFFRLFPKIHFRYVRHFFPEKLNNTRISNLRLKDISVIWRKGDWSRRYFKKTKNIRQGDLSEKGILLFEPSGQKDVLRQEADVYVFNPWEKFMPPAFEYELSRLILPAIDAVETIRLASENMKASLSLLYEDISNDFCRNLMQYLKVVHSFQQLEETASICDAYWKVPPFQGTGALLNEYCMKSKGITVTGVQSRATFFVGQIRSPYIPVSVLSRCHRYLTQSGAKKDSKALYPSSAATPEIIVSTANEEGTKMKPHFDKRKPADVAIYLTPVSSFTKTGQVSLYVQAREELLRFLNEQQGKEIHVVPYSIPSIRNCATLLLLKKLGNVTLIYNATQENYLVKYAPKLILMDAPTPYLGDVLHEDIPVIIMEDKAVVFGEEVLAMLKQQVHYAGELAECIRLLEMHFEGSLPSKRDDSYMKKFAVQ